MAAICDDSTQEKSSCCCKNPAVKMAVAAWTFGDYYGATLCRLSDRFRSNYRVAPGLYSLGAPTPDTPVFVTANYKLSFDHLRKSLSVLDAWILVLDTRGINVWCAAGKGTFGTDELVRRIESEKLASNVSHKNLIVPQLGAPGIAAHEVKKRSGFSVTYGPVRAGDINAFVNNNCIPAPAMKTVTFTFWERVVLIPIEVVSIVIKSFLPLLLLLLVMGLKREGILFHEMWFLSLPIVKALGTAIFAGCIAHPILLPLLPVRSFALQGVLLGLLAGVLLNVSGALSHASIYTQCASYLLIVALSSYCAFNFTGSTPIANKSGVKKELRIAIPLYIGAAVTTVILLLVSKINQWGVL